MYLHQSTIMSSYFSFSLLSNKNASENKSLQIHIVKSNIK